MLNKLCDLSFLKYYFLKTFGKTNDFSGDYKNWSSALSKSKSYQDTETLNQIKNASLIGFQNDKFYRDGVVFDEYEFSPYLNSLLLTVNTDRYLKKNLNKPISVIDFGGGLGTLYVQFKKYCQLYDLKINLQWHIIEQDDLAKFGKKNFKKRGGGKNLNFYNLSEINLKDMKPDLVIFSSVLNFIKSPYLIINKFKKTKPKYIFIDRTFFWDGDTVHISILKANKCIKGNYPCYIFSYENFKSHFEDLYAFKEYFICKESAFFFDKFKKGNYRGMVWQLK